MLLSTGFSALCDLFPLSRLTSTGVLRAIFFRLFLCIAHMVSTFHFSPCTRGLRVFAWLVHSPLHSYCFYRRMGLEMAMFLRIPDDNGWIVALGRLLFISYHCSSRGKEAEIADIAQSNEITKS